MSKTRIRSHLKKLMKERKAEIRDVVRGTGLTDPTVRRWYNDEIKRLDPDTITALCDYLECEPSELYSFEKIDNDE